MVLEAGKSKGTPPGSGEDLRTGHDVAKGGEQAEDTQGTCGKPTFGKPALAVSHRLSESSLGSFLRPGPPRLATPRGPTSECLDGN